MRPEPITAAQIRAVLDRAEASGPHPVGQSRFGPLPVRVHGNNAGWVEQVVRHATGDPHSAPWPEVTVHLLDEHAVPADLLPAGVAPPTDGVAHGSWVFVDGPCIATRSDSLVWFADADSRRALRWAATTESLPEWEAERPLRFVLRWAAAQHGAALLHCAAVAGATGGVALTGRGGVGKSTTSFACLGNGLRLLGDDYCIVDPTAPVPTVHSTYVVGNLDDRSLSLLPHLRSRVIGDAPMGKRVVTLDALGHHSSAPLLAACAVVQAPGERTRLVPISKAALLRSLAPSTQVQIPGVQNETFAASVDVVRKVDAYELRVGSLAEVPDVLAALAGGA